MAKLGQSLRDDYDKINSPLVPQPQNVASAMGRTSVPTPAVSGLGDLMAPASNAASSAAPVDPGTTGATAPQGGGQDFEAKVKRNESFLGNPDIQNALLDFAIQVMSPGLTTEQQMEQKKLDMQERNMLFDNGIAQQQLGIAQQNLQINQMDSKEKIRKSQEEAHQLQRRQQLFDGVSRGGKLEDMPTDDLVDLAGHLLQVGDADGAKVAIQMADTRRQANSTPDMIEWRQAQADGSFTGGLNAYLQQKIKAGVAPGPLAGLDPVLAKEGTDLSRQSDMLQGQIQDLQNTRELVKKTSTGALTELTLPLRSAMKQIGVEWGDKKEGDQVDLQQALRAQQGQLSLRMRNPDSGFGLTGNTSQADLDFLKQIVGSLSNTPDANEAILTVMIGKQRRDAELAELKSNYIFDNKTLAGWSKAKKEYIDSHDFLTQEEKNYLSRMGEPMTNAPGDPGGPGKNEVEIPKTPPDTLSEEDKQNWTFYSDDAKRYLMGKK